MTEKQLNRSKEADNDLVFSYLTMRNLIGFCGMLLPIALAIAPNRTTKYYGLEPSISDYYFTESGDLLVVILSVLAVFLFTYYGYNKQERILTLAAAIGALGVAFVPTTYKNDDKETFFGVHTDTGGIVSSIFDIRNIVGEPAHLTFAVVFLLCLAVMSLKFFPRTDAPTFRKPDGSLTQKGKRNRVYKICGWTMIGCIGVLVLYFAIKPDLKNFPVIFVFEAIAVEAFAISWLTKGETLWPDKEHYMVTAFKQMKGETQDK
jgi:hypothetical protein